MTNNILPNEFDVNLVTFGEPKPMGNQGGKTIPISYNGRPLLLETTDMKAPYGASSFEDPTSKEIKLSLSLSFGDYENNPKLASLHNAISNIDNLIISKAVENCQSWMRAKSMTHEVAAALYTSSIQVSKDRETGEVNNKYPPTIKTKLPCYQGELSTKIFDENRVAVDTTTQTIQTTIPKQSSVRGLIRCKSIWVAGGKFGAIWNVEQLKITNREDAVSRWPFLED